MTYDLKSFRQRGNVEAGNCAALEEVKEVKEVKEADLSMIENEDILSFDEREQARAMFSYIYERSDEESAGEEYDNEESDEEDDEELDDDEPYDDDEKYGYNEQYGYNDYCGQYNHYY